MKNFSNSRLKIAIDSHYRETTVFTVVSESGLHELTEVYLVVEGAYRSFPCGGGAEALILPNAYEITIVPSYNSYRLYPLVANHASTWLLKGNDIEKFSIKCDWLKGNSINVYLRCITKDINCSEITEIKSDIVLLERWGESTDCTKSFLYENKSMESDFEIELYKALISKEFSYIDSLRNDILLVLIDEISSVMKNEVNLSRPQKTAFDFSYHPMIVDKLFLLIEELQKRNRGEILLLRPSIWGMGVDLKALLRKMLELKKMLTK